MRRMRIGRFLIVAAIGGVLAGGCPWFVEPPGDNDNGMVNDNANDNSGGDNQNENGDNDNLSGGGNENDNDNDNDNDNGSGADNDNDNGGSGAPKVTVGVPAKRIGFELIGIHDPASSQYDGDCIRCHTDRTGEVALDGRTPAAHSVMQFRFLGQGNERCVACHGSGPDFLSYSAGGLRELVSLERDLAPESSCTSCHSGEGSLTFYVRSPF